MTQGEAMPKQDDPVSRGMNGGTEQRLHRQLDRAFQNSFGAENGLRVLVQLATSQMLATGAPRSAIEQALKRVVAEHPRGSKVSDVVIGESRFEAIGAKMLEWSTCTDVVADVL